MSEDKRTKQKIYKKKEKNTPKRGKITTRGNTENKSGLLFGDLNKENLATAYSTHAIFSQAILKLIPSSL